jgi:hypothetical protein
MRRTTLALLAAGLLAPPAAARPQGPDPEPAPPVAPPAAPAVPTPNTPPPDASAPIQPTPPAGDAAKPPAKDDPTAKSAKGKDDKTGKPRPPLPRAAILEDVTGTVAAVDRKAHRIEIDTPTGRVALSMDRNTLVYGPRGLVTPFEVVPGAQVRAGRNADFVAYWVAVRAPRTPGAVSTPDQGTGPGGGAGAPAEPNSGPAAPVSQPSTVGPGSAAPGTTSSGPGTPGP